MRIADDKAWKRYGSITTSAIGLRPVTPGERSESAESGLKANSELQFCSPDPDLSL